MSTNTHLPGTAERVAYLRAKKVGPRRVVVPTRHLMVWIGAEDPTTEKAAE